MQDTMKASPQPADNEAQIQKVIATIQAQGFKNPLLADFADYLISPNAEQAFYSSQLNAPFVESCYISSSKLMLYHFDSDFADCISKEGVDRQKLDAVYNELQSLWRDRRRSVIAGSCIILDFRENYLFITTSDFFLSRTNGVYRILKAKSGSGANYLYNGAKLYVRASSGMKLWDFPVNVLANSINKNLDFPFLANILVSCINHSLGPEPHLLRDILAHSTQAWEEVMGLLSVPFKQSVLKNKRTKLALLKHTGGVVSKFSGKLPFSQALAFVSATKQIKKENYDYLVNSYRAHKEMRQASGSFQLLKNYYMLKYGIPVPKIERAFFVGQHPSHEVQLIMDYLSISSTLRRKVDLAITTLKRMDEIHINLALTLKVNRLEVHKDFDLIKAEGLELIKTPYRLIEEGVKQHHCVASYANSINSGYCGIYSIMYDKELYTLEVGRASVLNRKTGRLMPEFAVRQIRGFANKAAPTGLRAHVKGLLNQTNKLARLDAGVAAGPPF